MDAVEAAEVAEVRMEGVDDMEVIDVQVEGMEDMEVVNFRAEEIEDLKVVKDVNMEVVEYVEIVEDMEMVNFEVEKIEDVEVVGDGEVVGVRVGEMEAVDFQIEEIEDVKVVELPRVCAPMFCRLAGVTHPLPERHNTGALNRVCRQSVCSETHQIGQPLDLTVPNFSR